jgi:hypothetical protein
MGKPALNGAQSIHLDNLWYNDIHSSPPWTKEHLRMRVREEIGELGGKGKPTTVALHFPFLILLSYSFYFDIIIFNFSLTSSSVLFNFTLAFFYIASVALVNCQFFFAGIESYPFLV